MIEHGVLEFWVFEGEDSFVDKIILLHPQPELHILNDINERDKFTDWFEVKESLKVSSVKYPNEFSWFLPPLI